VQGETGISSTPLVLRIGFDRFIVRQGDPLDANFAIHDTTSLDLHGDDTAASMLRRRWRPKPTRPVGQGGKQVAARVKNVCKALVICG